MAVAGIGLQAPARAPVALRRALPEPETHVPQAKARPRELRNTIALLIAILLVSVISLLYMTQAGRLATSGYRISNLQQERDRLQRENQSLQVELSQLHSLPYIQDTATNKLHMTKGELARVQYVKLDAKQLQVASTPDGLNTGS
ncbi:MAG TPA: cell division protein FtsL [Chloroflexota bacterium]|nr:cell division protein FtsL [Chloroflexota bacterium]